MTLRSLFLPALIFGAAFTSFSQNCLPNGITINSQQQINNFPTNYPTCTKIGGDVVISGPGINSLAGLGSVQKIDGSLVIQQNENLHQLTGLNALTRIDGNLMIMGNSHITDLSGLNSLKSVGGFVSVSNESSFVSYSGLDSLTSIGADLEADHLGPGFIGFRGLESLDSIGGTLYISYNPGLLDLEGLASLRHLGTDLDIIENPLLTSLVGLDSLRPGSITNLTVTRNLALSDCSVMGICLYLASPTGIVTIGQNATGCKTLEEVQAGCLPFSVPVSRAGSGVTIYPNPCSSVTTIKTDPPAVIESVTVFDQPGRKIAELPVVDSTLDVSGLAPGLYFLVFRSGTAMVHASLIIQ